MSKGRGGSKKRPMVGNPDDPDGFAAFLIKFLEWMRIQNYSERTVEGRESYLRRFVVWCEERGLAKPNEVSKAIVERYQRFLFHTRKKNGDPLSFRSQSLHLLAIRSYFKWLTKQNYILFNPAAEIDLPKVENRLPRAVLTQSEAESVINQADVNKFMGVRDRAIMETLYSTGMRRMELIGLKLYDLDVERGTIFVRQGKGRKDRMIPVGERCLMWIEKYRYQERPELASYPDDSTIFLTHLGQPFSPQRLTSTIRRYVEKAETGKSGSCHLFRHTMATLMLENGADIRYIQAMLGHVRLDTTQIYTQVSIRALKQIHTATHPAKMERTRKLFEDEVVDEATELLNDLGDDALDDPE
jgi:integrase/recombinase XerD